MTNIYSLLMFLLMAIIGLAALLGGFWLCENVDFFREDDDSYGWEKLEEKMKDEDE